MLNIIERLDRSKFSPGVCVSRKGGDLDREVEKMGIPFIEADFTIPAKPYSTLPFRAWQASRPFRGYGFDIWHSFHYAGDYTEPILARMSGAKAWVYTKKNMNWTDRSWKARTVLASRIAVQNTDMMKEFFPSGTSQRKARLIPRGVVTDRFMPDVPPRLRLRESLRIHPSTIVIGCVGHLVPVKGHPTLLGAMQSVPSAHLLIAGKRLDESYVRSLSGLAHDLGIADRVHFLDNVTDIPAFNAEIDIFVLPTWAKWRMEGCPVALLEAMSCGRACIATDIPGSRDLIEHGSSGLLVPPENPSALSYALTTLIENPTLRMRLGEAARKRVLNHYTIEHEVAAHEQMYSELLG